jgi:hypothetical protein
MVAVVIAIEPVRDKVRLFYVWMAAVCALVAFGSRNARNAGRFSPSKSARRIPPRWAEISEPDARFHFRGTLESLRDNPAH